MLCSLNILYNELKLDVLNTVYTFKWLRATLRNTDCSSLLFCTIQDFYIGKRAAVEILKLLCVNLFVTCAAIKGWFSFFDIVLCLSCIILISMTLSSGLRGLRRWLNEYELWSLCRCYWKYYLDCRQLMKIVNHSSWWVAQGPFLLPHLSDWSLWCRLITAFAFVFFPFS